MNKEKELIRGLYDDFKEIINMNQNLYIIPTEFYNQLMKKLGHLDDKLKRQTEALKRNQKTITEQRREIKKLKTNKEKIDNLNGDKTSFDLFKKLAKQRGFSIPDFNKCLRERVNLEDKKLKEVKNA